MIKKIILFFVSGLLLFQSPRAAVFTVSNEPDSAYIFAYTTTKNGNHNGLHFAWSMDRNHWHSIGPEYSFLRSDYGRWGSEKRMFDPVLYQDNHGLWHCEWTVNAQGNIVAHAASSNLVDWKRQSYAVGQSLPDNQNQQRLQVLIDGDLQNGTEHFVAWEVVEKLMNAQKLATYKWKTYSETAKEDPQRFAGLKPVEISIRPDISNSKQISDLLIGIFFEDINYAADGGLYAELVQNRDFEYDLSDKEGHDANWNHRTAWTFSGSPGAEFNIDTVAPVHPNNKYYAVLTSGEPGMKLSNSGFGNIAVKAGEKYDFSIFARMMEGKGGKITVRLVDMPSGKVYGETSTPNIQSAWKKYSAEITATESSSGLVLEIIPQLTGTVAIDMVSLFPQQTFKGRKNGLRADLAQTIADIHPRFVRFPGGCVAHGDGLENIYRWKNTIGPLEARKPMRNLWGYHQTAGLGYFEYFQFCEDIGAEPLPVVAAGVPCQNSATHGHVLGGQQGGIPLCEMEDYVQEILDLIEWANGDVKTQWGQIRAEAGHPEPFNLKYIGVGNEDLITDVFEERFAMIFNAVKEKYPEMTVIGTVGPFSEGTDYAEGWELATRLEVPVVDEHYYQPPGWYVHNQDYYDKYDRNKSKVYLGEYAAHLPGRPNNIETALAEALHIINLERNGDIVAMSSYAPLLAKEGHTQWNPDLIYFNNTEVKPTVGYYVQQLCGQNSGDEYIPVDITVSERRQEVQQRIAVSYVRDNQNGDLIIKFVNYLPVAVKVNFDLTGFETANMLAAKAILQGSPDDKTARPEQTSFAVEEMSGMEIPAYSFTVIRVQTH